MSVPTPVVFVDRDGTIIEEPADFQIDSYEKLALVDGVIPAMLRLRDAGWEFVMVSNQDGLGSDTFPQQSFDGPHALLLQILASQGITFRDILIDATRPEDNAPTRKPGLAMFTELLKDRAIDWQRSVVVGDRDTDAALARNLGIEAFLLASRASATEPAATERTTWAAIAHDLTTRPRRAHVQRNTNETQISVDVDLDTPGRIEIETGLGFYDHMLDQLAKHGGFSLRVRCAGDLHIDEHHTIEDVALAIGEALTTALGDKRGIGRYGFTLPMDEAQASAALDFSGRPYCVVECDFARERVGDFPTEMVPHFWRSLCEAAGITLHLKVTGDNDHHQIEVGFKAVARALRQALRRDGFDLPSTKGVL